MDFGAAANNAVNTANSAITNAQYLHNTAQENAGTIKKTS